MTMDGLQTFDPPKLAAKEVEVESKTPEYLASVLDRIEQLSHYNSLKTDTFGIASHLVDCGSNWVGSESHAYTCTGFVCYALDYPSVLIPDDLVILWIGNGLRTKYALSAERMRTLFIKLLKVRHEDTVTHVAIEALNLWAKNLVNRKLKFTGRRLQRSLKKLNTNS